MAGHPSKRTLYHYRRNFHPSRLSGALTDADPSVSFAILSNPSEVSMTKLLRFTKLLARILPILLFAAPVFAQDQAAVISGRVMSEHGQPLAGANVLIPELNISVATSPAGALTITI